MMEGAVFVAGLTPLVGTVVLVLRTTYPPPILVPGTRPSFEEEEVPPVTRRAEARLRLLWVNFLASLLVPLVIDGVVVVVEEEVVVVVVVVVEGGVVVLVEGTVVSASEVELVSVVEVAPTGGLAELLAGRGGDCDDGDDDEGSEEEEVVVVVVVVLMGSAEEVLVGESLSVFVNFVVAVMKPSSGLLISSGERDPHGRGDEAREEAGSPTSSGNDPGVEEAPPSSSFSTRCDEGLTGSTRQ